MFNPDIDIPDLSGRVILVTGGNTGLGRETCLSLAKHNPQRLFIAARNAKTAGSVINDIKQLAPQLEIEISAQAPTALTCFSAMLGFWVPPPGLTVDGYEIHFGVNHLGHALLVQLLLPKLLETTVVQPDVRVIVTTSDGYRFHAAEGIAFKDLRTTQLKLSFLNSLGGKDSWRRYSQSKLANLVYTDGLAYRYPAVKFVAIHPGVCDTTLTPAWIKSNALSRRLFAPGGLKTAEEGSLNQLWAATGSDVTSGQYYEPIGIVGYRTPKAKEIKLREDLWEWTETQLKKWTV
ncbi:NAD(P)-binding protein [Cadophora sp. DSE1049]|nr:NAD(P)-binding protein [Cadophora sp. DSE1049]